jgi:hypothetical protein
MHLWHHHVNGVSLQKVYTNIHTQGTALASVLNYISMMFLICIHEGIGLWAEKGALLAVVFGALFVDHLCHIVHALPPKKINQVFISYNT